MQNHPFRLITLFVLLIGLAVPAVAQESTPEATADPAATNLIDGCVDNYDPNTDYFPDKAEVTYATGFEVTYENNYKVVDLLTPWTGAGQTFTYLLVQCGTPAPDDIAADVVLDVPVQRFVGMSTTFLPHLDDQNLLDTLIGVDTLLYTSNENVLALADDLAQVQGGGSGQDINTERLIELEPDLVMTQQFSAAGTALDTIAETGVPVVLNGDFADTTPLGQAEWGKYLALFFNTEAAASDKFDQVETLYVDFASLTDDVDERPSVMAASPFSGTWYMPGGDSYVAALIDDAGGDFLWAEEPGTSLALDIEVVLERAQNADYWVNANQFWGTAADALATDERFAEFDAFTEGRIWNNNKQQNANGGNAYFEAGVANPHLLLADLIAILHPELLPDHEFEFYQLLTFAETDSDS